MVWGKNWEWKAWKSNPGHLWLEQPVLCSWATTARQPPTLTILYTWSRDFCCQIWSTEVATNLDTKCVCMYPYYYTTSSSNWIYLSCSCAGWQEILWLVVLYTSTVVQIVTTDSRNQLVLFGQLYSADYIYPYISIWVCLFGEWKPSQEFLIIL